MRVIFAGVLMEAGFLTLAFLGDLRYHLPIFFAIYAAQFGLMIWVYRMSSSAVVGGGSIMMDPRQSHSGMTKIVIIGFAILFRLTLLPTIPSLSDDIYRYNWEGRVQRAGWSPYEFPPSAPELTFLRDETYPLINHNAVPTIYPPLTQISFRVGTYLADGIRYTIPHLASPLKGEEFSNPLALQRERVGVRDGLAVAVLSQKAVFLFFDALTIYVLLALLRQRGIPEKNILLYAWNPLVVIEFSGSGHNDSLGIFYLLVGLLCWERGKSIWATFGFAASFLSKYLSVLLVPFFLWKKKWKELGIWALFVMAGLVPFCFCWMMVHGATHYAARWQFNGSFYVILDKLSPKPEWAKWTAAAMLGIVAAALGRSQKDILRLSYLLVSASLLLAPTVHPWYFVWIIPFLCFYPHPAFLVWNLTIILSYTVWRRYSHDAVWDLHPGIQILEYLPVYTLLIHEHFRHHPRAE